MMVGSTVLKTLNWKGSALQSLLPVTFNTTDDPSDADVESHDA